MTDYPWLALVAPVMGALATFFLARGNRVRRARAAALEDLKLYEGSLTAWGPRDPLVDQLKEHARRSVRHYSNRRVGAEQAVGTWVSLGVILFLSIVLGVPFYLADNFSWPVVMAAGALGGVAGSVAEGAIARLRVRLALRGLPTAPKPGVV